MSKRVLVLGSGALKIGEAGEFDYSGSQALKALREEGIFTILVNPNIATNQTSKELADKIYFLPVTAHFVTQVIKKETPDGVLLGFGGQTALNCGLALNKQKIFKKFAVQILGTPIKSIRTTEDRKLFAAELTKLGMKTAEGETVSAVQEAADVARKIGYPVIIRSGFTLGGLGSSVVKHEKELVKIAALALKHAPQIAVEKYLKHWKEIEYEVVRDKRGNKITVCNMENLDPLGIHTGESIVIAPSQTLNNFQYHLLREASLRVIEHLKIVGECNIQFALDPKSNEFRVIEVNARLSRSSALASKATGYPLAYVAAKLALGKELPFLRNSVTGQTSAFFEPSLDYITVKIPRWDLQKFTSADDGIGTEMKSVGEIMAIGRDFPETLQKGIRMLEIGQDGLLNNSYRRLRSRKTQRQFLSPSTKRLFTVAYEMEIGTPIQKIYRNTGIDPWFLYQIERIVNFEKGLKNGSLHLSEVVIRQAKKLGFSDKLIANYFELTEEKIRILRKRWQITPSVKHIDTLAAEYPAKTNYLYLTYNAQDSETTKPSRGKKAIVLGSGPYRIGSSVEFDWCSVACAKTFRKNGWETIIINCNPETVSTDFDSADKLYFEELTLERVLDICEIEKTAKLVLAFGGQTANNLAPAIRRTNIEVLGTSPTSIDNAEDRHKFSSLLDKLEIDQPKWQSVTTIQEAVSFASKVSYPVLVRPSYVLSGSAMKTAYTPSQLREYLEQASEVSREHPVVISKFIDNAQEVEIDGVAKNGRLILEAITEHIENAGVHSGDATVVLPARSLSDKTAHEIKRIAQKIIRPLAISGPFNIQFLAKNGTVQVIELNLRSSRSFPFVSKATGVNFVQTASEIMLGKKVKRVNYANGNYFAVKAPQFSFNRIKNADPKLRVEMASTGEVACFGKDFDDAYLKALLSTGFRFPKKSVFLSIGGVKNKEDFLESAGKLRDLGLKIYATDKTSSFLKSAGLHCHKVFKISEKQNPNVVDLLTSNKVDLAINISEEGHPAKGKQDGFIIRRTCADLGIPLFTNPQAARALAQALSQKKLEDLEIKSWDRYVKT